MEIWKDIKGYEGLYQISTLGRVRSFDRYVKNRMSNKNIKRGKILTPCTNRDGYKQLNLIINTKKKPKTIHRLVAETFISNPENKPCVNHIDGDKKNNNVKNLEWVTYSENTIHALKKGLKIPLKGMNHYKRPINQFTLDGKFVKRWESIKQVQEEWHLKSTHISACCRRKIKTSLGYKWEYAN